MNTDPDRENSSGKVSTKKYTCRSSQIALGYKNNSPNFAGCLENRGSTI